jgi:hypothetical protein
MTIDLTSSVPMVSLAKDNGELISTGPASDIKWMRFTEPDEFNHPTPTPFLWWVEFKVGDGTGDMVFNLPPGTGGPEDAYSNLEVNVQGRTWGYNCLPTMVSSH